MFFADTDSWEHFHGVSKAVYAMASGRVDTHDRDMADQICNLDTLNWVFEQKKVVFVDLWLIYCKSVTDF